MENNVIKENYLEVLPSQEIITKKEVNTLPIVKDTSSLLPVIVQQRELALIEIKKEFYKIRKHHSLKGILKFIKNVTKLLLKLVRLCILSSIKIIGFVAVSAIVVITTAIITKNIINSYYGVEPQEDITYSIFNMKDDASEK